MLVRALTFRKCFAQTKHQSRWWALIGHFDELECSELKAMTLEQIQDYNSTVFKQDSKESYHHTIFLIHNSSCGRTPEDDQRFWNTGMDFVSITRIHFPQTVGLQKQYDEITEYFASLSSSPEYKQICWRTYYTMELSDMVLVSKSPCLQVLSRWSLLATKTKLVGSAYTYLGIPGMWVDNSSSLPSTLKTDIIDFLAIRFSIQGGNVNSALSSIRNCIGQDFTTPVFRVAGNEDAIICGQNVPTENLVRLYQEWYSDDSDVLTTFRDIITRLGADWSVTPPPMETASYQRQETELEKYSTAVLDKVHNCVLCIEDLQDAQWLRPLVTLTNALVHMSQSATLDEPVFLILPGLNAFWDNILDEDQRNTNEQIFHRFAELCIHTMEHLMRAEGQLSHRLEMRPLTYDMPVFVLEYATAFLLSLSKALTADDGKNAKRIFFLLVPSTSLTVFTDELFSASENNPGLLQTTVPFSMLYKPKYLLPSLCHEMAHYVGENIRMRDKRYWYFLRSVAQDIIRYFFDHVSDESNRFQEFLVHEFLDKSLRNLITEYNPCSSDKIVTFSLIDIMSLIRRVVQDLLSEEHPSAYADLIRSYITNPTYCGAQLYSLPRLALQDRFDRFVHRLDDLVAYYREPYADLCMLCLLHLQPQEYLKTAVVRWDTLNTGILFQAYACLTAFGCSLTEIVEAFEIWGQTEGIDGKKRDQARNEILLLDQLIHTSSAEKYVLQYLKDCWTYLGETKLGAKKEDTVYTAKDIFDKLLGIDSCTEYPQILEVIDYGRQELLKELSCILQ